MQQYGRNATPIASAFINKGLFIDSQQTVATISDSSIQTYLTNLLNAGTLLPSNSTIFGVYFPSGMQVTMGSNSSCSNFCGLSQPFHLSDLHADLHDQVRCVSLPGLFGLFADGENPGGHADNYWQP